MEAEERSDDSQRDDAHDKWQDAIRVKPESQKRWDVIKVILRSFTLLCAIALVVFCVRSGRVYGDFLPDTYSIAFIGCVAPASISGFWALAEFITLCVRTRRSGLRLTGIPPGAHVAVDLLLWLATLVFMVLLGVWFIAAFQASWYYPGLSGEQMGITLAALCFELALTALHFTLFVRACIETERRNSERRIKKAIMSLSQRGLNLGSASNWIIQRSHTLSTPPPESVIEEPMNRLPESPIPPDQRSDAEADVEAETRTEDNVKFIMPASVIREMTVQKYTMMGPADGEQKRFTSARPVMNQSIGENNILLAARKPGKGGYIVKNPRSRCIGIAAKKTAGSLPDLTVGHLGGCECLDVRLIALCRHADRMVKLGRLRRARKYDLVLALKLRSPALPEELRLKVRRQRRKAGIDDGEDEEVLRVLEYRNTQRLTETWKNLEAYRKRRVWLDWYDLRKTFWLKKTV
ncbi:hypothetical protein DL770_005908 [Monosporascus sp. CRB-9-2]|nr:hypothetical protein DL770_005908 [Monosporascus sp. CRB-9-2]